MKIFGLVYLTSFFVALAFPLGDARLEDSIPESAVISVIYGYYLLELSFFSSKHHYLPIIRNYIRAILTAVACAVMIRIAYYSYENGSHVTIVACLVLSIAFLISGPLFAVGGMNRDDDPTQ